MKLLKGKSRRTRLFALITFGVIIALVGVNFLLTFFGGKTNAYVDLTPEKLYTLTDTMEEECSFLNELGEDEKVEIIFCNDPDYLVDETLTRVTYFMALELQKRFSAVNVVAKSVENNPTFVAKYKPSSLSTIAPTDVIIAYGDRYRIVSAANFWTTGSTGAFFSYNGEYRMTSILKSVTLAHDKKPTAYFVTDHGETYFDPANPTSAMSLKASELASLIYESGLNIATIELSKVKEIPSDCALLIINNPRIDYTLITPEYDRFDYVSEVEMLDRYMVKNQGAIMVAKDFSLSLPVFEDFLYEWGFDLSDTQAKDTADPLGNPLDQSSTELIMYYDTVEDSYGNAIYGNYANLSSAPKCVTDNAGYIKTSFGESGLVTEPGTGDVSRNFCRFLMAASTVKAYAKESDDGYIHPTDDPVTVLAAVTVRSDFDSHSAEYVYSYLFCSNSADFFSNETLSDASYANYDVMALLVNNISRVDYYASLELGGTSVNSSSYGGKQLVSSELSTEDKNIYSPDASEIVKVNRGITTAHKIVYTAIVASVPTMLLILGIVVCVKRKFK